MSVPTFTGMTAIETNDLAQDDEWGQNRNKWTSETLYAKEGTACNMTKFNVTGLGGGGDNGVGGVNGTTNLFVGWVLLITSGNVDSFANKGAFINLSSSSSSLRTNYSDWNIGGNDTPWVGRGWRCCALDASRTADTTGGTFSSTNVQSMGFGFTATGTNAQYPAFGIDMFYYGAGVEVTGPSLLDGSNGIDLNENGASADTIDRNDGGSFITDGWEVGDYVKIVGSATSANDGEYEIKGVTASVLTLSVGDLTADDLANTTLRILCSVTLEDIYNWDRNETSNTNPMTGVVDKDTAGTFVINYPLIIGDQSGSNSIYFRSVGDSVVFSDQPLNTTREDYIQFAEDTGKTYFQISGAGLSGTTITGERTVFTTGTPRGVDWGTAITGLDVRNASFSNLDGGLDLAASANHSYTSCTFDSCGIIVHGANTIFTNNLITSSIGSAAVKTSDVGDISDCVFISAGTGHAIELDSSHSGNTYTLTNFSYEGYAATDGSTGNEVIYNNSGGAVTLNISGGDTPTIRNGSGASTTVIVNPVDLQITIQDITTGSPIQDVQTLVWVTDGTNFPYEDSVSITSSGTTATVTHTGHGLATGDDVIIQGADQDAYNGAHEITVTGNNTYTYTMPESAVSPATGTILSTFAYINEDSNASGICLDNRSISADQPVTGWARKHDSSPYYQQGVISGTVDKDNGLAITLQLIRDE